MINPEHLSALLTGQAKITAPAGTFLLAQGEPSSHFFFLYEGIVRAVYDSEQGQQRVKEFYFPGECCFLYLSWLTKTPAQYALQVVEKVIYSALPLTLLDAPDHHCLALSLMRQQLIYKEKKEQMLLLHSPENRYRYLMHHFPDWFGKLTQQDLASYIGISPVSLSRIRRRINKG